MERSYDGCCTIELVLRSCKAEVLTVSSSQTQALRRQILSNPLIMLKTESAEVRQNQVQSSASRYTIWMLLSKLLNLCDSTTTTTTALNHKPECSSKESIRKVSVPVHSAKRCPSSVNNKDTYWVNHNLHSLLYCTVSQTKTWILQHRLSRMHF